MTDTRIQQFLTKTSWNCMNDVGGREGARGEVTTPPQLAPAPESLNSPSRLVEYVVNFDSTLSTVSTTSCCTVTGTSHFPAAFRPVLC